MADETQGDVVLYTREDGAPALAVRLDAETVWLTQQQIADLFQTTQQNVSLHLRNIYDEGELREAATHKDFLLVRREGARDVRRSVIHYNLDVIISVGYRVKSKIATQFRIWATARLRDYLVQGYAINDQRLQELGQVVSILGRSVDELVSGTAQVISSFLPGLALLRDYDEGQIETVGGSVPAWQLTLDEARAVIASVAAEFPSDELFGRERGDALDGVIAAIYQGFGGQDLYPSIEEKAANLLYFVVKDHPLSDGNKRSGAALFVTFLARNGALYDVEGRLRIANNALAAITLMVAMSNPKEKDLMIALLVRMLTEDKA